MDKFTASIGRMTHAKNFGPTISMLLTLCHAPVRLNRLRHLIRCHLVHLSPHHHISHFSHPHTYGATDPAVIVHNNNKQWHHTPNTGLTVVL
jgi:hypothetical protein